MSEWQPINTAPKDGQWLWVLTEKTGRISAFKWDLSHDAWFSGSGRWASLDTMYSHWQLLGNPPELPRKETLEELVEWKKEALESLAKWYKLGDALLPFLPTPSLGTHVQTYLLRIVNKLNEAQRNESYWRMKYNALFRSLGEP